MTPLTRLTLLRFVGGFMSWRAGSGGGIRRLTEIDADHAVARLREEVAAKDVICGVAGQRTIGTPRWGSETDHRDTGGLRAVGAHLGVRLQPGVPPDPGRSGRQFLLGDGLRRPGAIDVGAPLSARPQGCGSVPFA